MVVIFTSVDSVVPLAVKIAFATPFKVLDVGVMAPQLILNDTGVPLGIFPWNDVSSPFESCVKSTVTVELPL